jgi:hypothetical protein
MIILFIEKVKATQQPTRREFSHKITVNFQENISPVHLMHNTYGMEFDKETNISLNSANGFKLTMHVYSEGWRGGGGEYKRIIIL